jgi:hypothetical protein
MKNLKILFLAIFTIGIISSCSDDDFTSESTSFTYQVHNGQVISSAAYNGRHNNEFSVTMKLESMENGNTLITATLNNTEAGATYHMHAHDGADPSMTPNGTPYDESPNGDVFVQMVEGNGNSVTVMQEANMSFEELTTQYSGFFVVHDPYQPISTVDIGTYLSVGSFAREQPEVQFKSQTFTYDFNVGQLVPAFAYSGSHDSDITANIVVNELADNMTRIVISLNNTIEGEMYNTHAHDMADAGSTPNGTPYNESPNVNVFAGQIMGNGSTASRSQISSMSYEEITNSYNGFLVVHDPLQPISTIDPTTYVILGVFAR